MEEFHNRIIQYLSIIDSSLVDRYKSSTVVLIPNIILLKIQDIIIAM